MKKLIILTTLLVFHAGFASAQILVEDQATPQSAASSERPKVGESAASDYFKKRAKVSPAAHRESSSIADGARVLGIHFGTFFNDTSYRWGKKNKAEDVGDWMLGVTYRMGEWTSSMDLNIRAELIGYEVDGERPLKLSVMPIVAFPDARSAFPMYFGAGLGVGVFFKQVGTESDISADYALIVGARFPDVWDGGGLFFETGLKGDIHILSSGQHEGVFFATGALFTF